MAKKLYSWAALKANSRLAPLWLGLIFLLELIFFIPLDAVLLVFCLENPLRRYLYVGVATIASLITGILGYYLGHLAWDWLEPYVLGYLISSQVFHRVVEHYHNVQHWAVFLGAFLPIPYKVVTLSAGVCHLSFFPFAAALVMARSARFFFIAKAIEKWGIRIKTFIDRHFHRFVMAFGLKIILTLSFFWALS